MPGDDGLMCRHDVAGTAEDSIVRATDILPVARMIEPSAGSYRRAGECRTSTTLLVGRMRVVDARHAPP
jgi:hypothetical protein